MEGYKSRVEQVLATICWIIVWDLPAIMSASEEEGGHRNADVVREVA